MIKRLVVGWLRALLLRAFPELRNALRLADVVGVRFAETRTNTEALRFDVQALRDDVEALRSNLIEWQRYTGEVGRLVMCHEREISMLKAREASGRTFRALDVRLARIEMLLHPPIDDCSVSLSDEALDDVVSRAIGGRDRGEPS